MTDPKKTAQTPKQPPRPSPQPPKFPGRIVENEKGRLPPVDQTPAMPPVKPPKKGQ